MSDTTIARHCLNCGTELSDAFCPHCGQRATVGRLSIKTAIIDNFWSAVRMDSKVVPTAVLLATKPWVVVRDYIHGHRVEFTQPVRFIVIMCFVNIIVQMFMPDTMTKSDTPALVAGSAADPMAMHLWHSVQEFLRDSRLAIDLIDSVIFAPFVYLLYLPWGSRRFNLAEYSTAYLYLCGASLVVDLITLPITYFSDDLGAFTQVAWWIFLVNGMVKHSFSFKRAYVRVLMLFMNIVLIAAIGTLTHIFLLGINLDI